MKGIRPTTLALIWFTMISCFFAHTVVADIPKVISYQGRITDSGGTPVADGTYTMEFKFFDAVTGGNQEWESGPVSVELSGGVFNVLIGGDGQPAMLLFFEEDYWMEVTFDGAVQTPRQRIASTGYAYMASGLVPGTRIEEAKYGEILYVKNFNTSGSSHGILGKTISSSGHAIIGNAEATSGNTRGVYGTCASPSGRAVMGYNSATTGNAYGVYGETNSPSGEAVYGINYNSSGSGKAIYGQTYSSEGTAVHGLASATTGVNYGGYFITHSSSGSGLRAIADATTGVTYGVYGRSYSTTDGARGVYGRSYATTGFTYGVRGQTASDEGYGVYGQAGSNSGNAFGGGFVSESGTGVAGWAYANSGLVNGVYGYTNSPDGRGVAGYNSSNSGDDAFGVFGRSMSSDSFGGWFENGATSSGTGVIGLGILQGGIFHDTNSGNWAACGRASYKILGTGTVDFVQNHPHKSDEVIVYAAPEGDEVATYTRGTARLTDGEATVSLGETFQWVTNPEIGLTAHLTPRGGGSVLYVESISTEEMIVRSYEGFPDNVYFDYLVYGLRIGFEEHSVVQEKDLEARIPDMSDHHDMYTRRPDLRQYNALERYTSMYASNGMQKTTGSLGADGLISLIGVHEHTESAKPVDEGLILPPKSINSDDVGDDIDIQQFEGSSEVESARAMDERR